VHRVHDVVDQDRRRSAPIHRGQDGGARRERGHQEPHRGVDGRPSGVVWLGGDILSATGRSLGRRGVGIRGA
jgi:hypothetical protein